MAKTKAVVRWFGVLALLNLIGSGLWLAVLCLSVAIDGKHDSTIAAIAAMLAFFSAAMAMKNLYKLVTEKDV